LIFDSENLNTLENPMKPERWSNPENKLFPYQVGFTSPPHDFDAAPSDFLRIAPETVGVHGRMLHVPGYEHQLVQRTKNFHLLEEFVECMSNNGADVTGQVGTNWVHCNGTTPDEIAAFCDRLSDQYETPFHMAGMCLVEGLRELNAEKIAVNSVYYWPDWRDGIVRFLKEAGFDVLYYGNFVDQGFYETQEQCNAQTWIFPGEMAEKSMLYVADQAPGADAIVINGMPNWRRQDGLPQRAVSLVDGFESVTGKSVVSSDFALYWRIFKTLGIAPERTPGRFHVLPLLHLNG
jgi:maleate cis-trans isomerase